MILKNFYRINIKLDLLCKQVIMKILFNIKFRKLTIKLMKLK